MNLFSAIAPFFIAIAVLWILSRLIVSEASPDRLARELDGGKVEFVANRKSFWGIYGFLACLGYVIASTAIAGISSPGESVPAVLCMGFVLLLLSAFPGTVTVTPEGLDQFYWLTRSRRIAWNDIKKIAVDEKKQRVTVSGRTGTKIVHTRQLPDRARFLAELEKHRPDLVQAQAKQPAPVATLS